MKAQLREWLGTWRCIVCGKESTAGLGWWACHTDNDTAPVHRGECWREYTKQKAELRTLGLWESLCPELGTDH